MYALYLYWIIWVKNVGNIYNLLFEIMERVFARYIELVGTNKIKENLKGALQQAIKEGKWALVKEITQEIMMMQIFL